MARVPTAAHWRDSARIPILFNRCAFGFPVTFIFIAYSRLELSISNSRHGVFWFIRALWLFCYGFFTLVTNGVSRPA